ncbi:adhesion G-protein coupled receptor F3 [Clupea harengus]|uniref:Adhesion G-protein coupled receptor F3 n=1 Tax=Clupea harengus TaxID=7950 RepID=A0A6P8GR44_CLUHA|nr:adhesion G-protein coupled receptor F3 [Clupea harengus]
MNGFEKLITTVSPNGASAEFEVTLAGVFKTAKLAKLIEGLKSSLPASISVETTGLVEMDSPSGKVPYKSKQELNCSIDDTLSTCSWFITKQGNEQPASIGNGSQVIVGSWCSNFTYLTLLQATGLWDGLYTCKFTDGSISHKASGNVSIDLLPDEITMISDPQTADCDVPDPDKVIGVTVKCVILPPTSPVEYTVTLSVSTFNGDPKTMVKEEGKSAENINYTCNIQVPCRERKPTIEAKCIFENSQNQNIEQNLKIPVLYNSDKFCEAEWPWKKTKAGSTATQPCPPKRTGNISRTCNEEGQWQSEKNYCVSEAINKLSSSVEYFKLGLNATPEVAVEIFSGLKNNSAAGSNLTLGDIQATIGILDGMADASSTVTLQDDSMMNDFIDSASNLLSTPWTDDTSASESLSKNYLKAVEELVVNIKLNQSEGHNSSNIELQVCRNDDTCNRTIMGVQMALSTTAHQSKVVALKNLANLLPNNIKNTESASIVVSATLENASHHTANITLAFPFDNTSATPDKIYCVFWETNGSRWSEEGCVARMETDTIICECSHLTSFSSLFSKEPVDSPVLSMITYIGLGISICSLLVFLFIEWLVWTAIVKSNLSHFRHTSLVNIALCLLLADCSFLASAFPLKLGEPCCFIMVLAKHFFFVAMFFWMLCLGLMLLHQLIFVFSPLRRKVYMILSFTIGYGGPTVTVGISYLYYSRWSESSYYDDTTCWLKYEGAMKGSLHAFLFPVGVITIMNLFSMVVVIMTLLRPNVSEGKADDKETLKSILKAIVFLTPVFGGTWLLGFLMFFMERSTFGVLLHYAFTIVNSLQGFFILVTGCLGEKRVRDEVLKYILVTKSPKSESRRNLTSSISKK